MTLEEIMERERMRMRNRVVWSFAGWKDAWANEHSFRSWVYANALSIPAALLLPLTSGERLVIIVVGMLILAAELLNTAIERLVDLVSPEPNELARRAKDTGSAGVAVTSLAGAFAWIWAIGRLLIDAAG